MGYRDRTTVAELLGKTITAIDGATVNSERITFECDDGSRFVMYHSQDCCEDVDLQDVCGDVADLIGSPVTLAEEATNDKEHPADYELPKYGHESFTWTFYRIGTERGMVTLRWLGTSNGYYSEGVDFERVQP